MSDKNNLSLPTMIAAGIGVAGLGLLAYQISTIASPSDLYSPKLRSSLQSSRTPNNSPSSPHSSKSKSLKVITPSPQSSKSESLKVSTPSPQSSKAKSIKVSTPSPQSFKAKSLKESTPSPQSSKSKSLKGSTPSPQSSKSKSLKGSTPSSSSNSSMRSPSFLIPNPSTSSVRISPSTIGRKSPLSSPLIGKCSICREDIDMKPKIALDCLHSFHRECLYSNYIYQLQMEEKDQYVCPLKKCQHPVTEMHIQKIIPFLNVE